MRRTSNPDHFRNAASAAANSSPSYNSTGNQISSPTCTKKRQSIAHISQNPVRHPFDRLTHTPVHKSVLTLSDIRP